LTDFSGDANPNKRLQYPVDRRPRYFWNSFPDVRKDLIGGRVILSNTEDFQNLSPLNCHGQSVSPTDLFQVPQLEAGMGSQPHGCNVLQLE
jgi:hypothetical protein